MSTDETYLFPDDPSLLELDFGDRRAAWVMEDGWSRQEAHWTWALGSFSTLNFGAVTSAGDGLLFLDIEPVASPALTAPPRLDVLVNGVQVEQRPMRVAFAQCVICDVPAAVLARSTILTITFLHPDWCRLADWSPSGDQRELAFMFREIRLKLLSPAERRQLHALRTSSGAPPASSDDLHLQVSAAGYDEILQDFVSLGLNCEFGFVQRRAGLERLSLLRFNGLPIRKLARGLRRRFADLGRPGFLRFVVLEALPGQGFIGYEDSYEMIYHTERHPHEIGPEALLAVEAPRLTYLGRKLIEDIEDGGKIFVLKRDGGLALEEVISILNLMAEIGDNILLWVETADDRHPVGLVELLAPNLMRGYIDKFAELTRGLQTISYEGWRLILRNSYEIRSRLRDGSLATAARCYPLEPSIPDATQNDGGKRKYRGLTNLALGKAASQSSVCAWSRYLVPEQDAAGANNGVISAEAGFHTDCEEAPWWQVDLGQPCNIRKIRIFNRRHMAERLRFFSLHVSADGSTWHEVFRKDTEETFGRHELIPFSVAFPDAIEARLVRLRLDAKDCLHFNEIEVLGEVR